MLRRLGSRTWHLLRTDRALAAGVIALGLLILLAVFAPLVIKIVGAPQPNTQNTNALSQSFAT